MSKFLKDLLKDKHGRYSLREIVIAICMLMVIASWVAQVLYSVEVPEYMFYSIISLIGAGCFGYSIEKQNL